MNTFSVHCKVRPGFISILSLVILSSLLFLSKPAIAQLSGTYTVCGSSCSYSSIGAAITDLTSKGVSGAVTFNVSAGTYNENITIPAISGASATNTITFKGAGRGKTILKGSSGANVIYLNGASYVSFDGFTVQNTSSSGNTVNESGTVLCSMLNSNILAVTGSSVADIVCTNTNFAVINNCYIYGGAYGMQFTGSGGSSTSPIGNLVFSNNRVVEFGSYGIYAFNNGGYIGVNNTYINNVLDSSYSSGSYGIYTQYESGAMYKNNKIIAATNYALLAYYPNYYLASTQYLIANNFITNFVYYGILMSFSSSGSNVLVAHNTVYSDSTMKPYAAVYIINSLTNKGLSVQNNIIEMLNSTPATGYGTVTLTGNASAINVFDGNDIVAPGLAYANIYGVPYTDYSSYQKAMKSNGWETNGSNIKPVFIKAPFNLHLNLTKTAPYAPYITGIGTDIDGDARCKIFPTAGADESGFGKGASLLKFTFPFKVFPGSPTTIFQTAKAGEPKIYHWYLNGAKVSDSATLVTSGFKIGVNTLKLVTITCVNQDSLTLTDTVKAPTSVPVADFIGNKNSIAVGDFITFKDISSNGPTKWLWTITPDSTLSSGVKVPTVKYIFGNSTTQNPSVQFNFGGQYKVCVTASNGVGTGSTVCKTNYINVVPSVNMGSVPVVHDIAGYLYDNGGPKGNYVSQSANGYVNTLLIDPCADSVYLAFSLFDTYCGYDYVRLFEGRNNAGKNLTGKCATNGTFFSGIGGGNGFTGGKVFVGCTYQCMPNVIKPDTFKAKNTIWVEMSTYEGGNGSAGFSAYWWSKPKTSKKPKASFYTTNSGDSVCIGHNVAFVNNTSIDANDPATFLWDLDGDISTFECVGSCKTATYPYNLKGGVKLTLIASNCAGIDTFTKVITPYYPAAPVSDFTVDNTTPTLNDVAFLNPNVAVCIDNYKWAITKNKGTGTTSFVNGTNAASASPQVTFSDTGYYDVSLFVDNASGKNSTVVKTKFIHVRQPYCTPTVTNLLPDIGITKVLFNTINNTTKPALADYTNFANNPSLATTVELGLSYTLTVKRDSPTYNPMTRTAYIDWNGDGTFSSSEILGVDSNSSAITWSKKIKIPNTAKPGATIMRIAVAAGSGTNYVCGQNSIGEYQDYRIYITPYHTLPVITLKGHQGLSDTIYIELGYTYAEDGFTARSLLNGDITSLVKKTTKTISGSPFGLYIISYNATDSGKLGAITQYRVVKYTKDKTPPLLTVGGPDTTLFEVTKLAVPKVRIPKVTSSIDLVNGNLTASVVVDSSKVKTNIVGTYIVSYTSTDLSGNRSIVYRAIKVIDTIPPVIKLKGKAVDTLGINNYYVDSGVVISDNYYNDSTLKSLLVVTSNLDTSNYATYTITYSITDPSGNKAKEVSRKVVIYDQIPPVIKVKGNLIDSIAVFSTYQDPGYITYDNLDNVSQIKVKVTGTFFTAFPTGVTKVTGNYTIIYTATDRAGNSASVTRIVKVRDWVPPVIHLVGPNITTVCRWAKYSDAGFTLTDNYDPKDSIKIQMTGTFITHGGTTVEGLYSLQYVATDRAGNVATSETRAIQVDPFSATECKSGIVSGLSLGKYISIYPNPNNGSFTISANLPAHENIRISVINVLGQEVAEIHNGILEQNSFKTDLSNQPGGIYFLKIASEKETATLRIEIAK